MTKSEHGFSHILVFLLFVLIIGVVGATGWLVYRRQYTKILSPRHTSTTQTVSSTSSTSATTNQPVTASAIVAAVRSALSKQYTVDPTGNDTAAGVILQNHIRFMVQQPFLSPYWRASGYHFFNNAATYSAVSFWFNTVSASGSSVPAALPSFQSFLEKQLTSYGMSAVSASSPVMQEQGYANPLLYTSAQAVCVVQTELDASAGVACANFTDYATAAALLQPFANAYAVIYPNDQSDAIFQASTNPKSPDITVQSNGYQSAAVEMADSWAYFYEVNGLWHFLYSTQLGLSCDFSQYPTAKPAFLGLSCLDNNGKPSTVK